MSARITPRRTLSDRVTNVAGCTWILGLIAWYAGGSTAIDRMLEPMALLVPVAIVGVISGAAALVAERRLEKGALGTALFLALGVVLLGFDLGALANRYGDGSSARTERATVLSFQDPAKGPRTVSLELRGQRVSFQATNAEGCSIGDRAAVELRDGALGAAWLQRIRCEP